MPQRQPRTTRPLRTRGAVAALIGLGIAAAVLVLRGLGVLMPLELFVYDGLMRAVPRLSGESPVSLVWIREQEIQEYGHPLPDRVLADTLSALLRHRPRAVGVDLYRDQSTGAGWEALEEVVLGHSQVVWVEKLADEHQPGVPPPPFLRDRSQVGFADVTLDPDGVARRGLLMLWDDGGRSFLSLSLQLALRQLFQEGITMGADPADPEVVRLGPTSLPPVEPDLGGYRRIDAGGSEVLLDYRRRGFPSASLGDVLAGRVDPELVRDRVVLVGTAAPSVKDDFLAPSGFLTDGDGRIYGAEHHAQAVDQLVRFGRGESEPARALPEAFEALCIVLGSLAGAALAVRVVSPAAWLLAFALGSVASVLVGWLGLAAGWWLPAGPTAVAGLGSLALVVAYVSQQERADKSKLRSLFGRFVSRRVVDQIWEDRDIFMEGDRPRPRRATVTVLMSDLSGYTSRSESAEPARVMDWIGAYMDRMAQLVEAHGGIVNDFLGDGLMATFGVPVLRTEEAEVAEDAAQAVESALRMADALEELNATWRREGNPTARLRVGVFTGDAVVGALGSAERMKYATVGDTVNTASRLESFDKVSFDADDSLCRILVGEPTWRRVSARFTADPLGDHVLKGKGEPVTIYRVRGRAG